ncbi:NapC/NirT family cytochrome c [Marinobacter sp. SS13-12]|uniref:NapC/NirT family cytochrome c n=1 Tax=Marinobacter sp. SS13-12 TaxID=3050451 RepID=UPI0025565BBF|nr:NapC/NirT family cytochrome c [Marinobacter sp. SS13-12]MDK8463076.1 NapC/NirT family cytochrome c [Marinobacter sp. SS13-12]
MAAGKNSDPEQKGWWQRFWQWPKTKYLLWIPAGGFVMLVTGAILLGSVNYAMEETNTLEFCTSCHEMGAFVYPEYEQSAHFSNQSGVRAVCSDCHVPKDWWGKVVRKTEATFNEIPSWITGKIDSPEKFEAHRREMAESVWAKMRASNSATCRSCHSYDAMALSMQDRYAKRRHSREYREATDKTCIDCHQGIAHNLPEVTAE